MQCTAWAREYFRSSPRGSSRQQSLRTVATDTYELSWVPVIGQWTSYVCSPLQSWNACGKDSSIHFSIPTRYGPELSPSWFGCRTPKFPMVFSHGSIMLWCMLLEETTRNRRGLQFSQALDCVHIKEMYHGGSFKLLDMGKKKTSGATK